MSVQNLMPVSVEGAELPVIFVDPEDDARPSLEKFYLIRDQLESLVDPAQTDGFFTPYAVKVLTESFRTSFLKWYDQCSSSVVKWGAFISYAATVVEVDKVKKFGGDFQPNEVFPFRTKWNGPMEKMVRSITLLGSTYSYLRSVLPDLLHSHLDNDPSSIMLLRIGKKEYHNALLRTIFQLPSEVQTSNALIYNLGPGTYFSNCLSYILTVILRAILDRATTLSDVSLLILRVPENFLESCPGVRILERDQTARLTASCLKHMEDPLAVEALAVVGKGICKNPVQVERCRSVKWYECSDSRCPCMKRVFELCIKSPVVGAQLIEAADIYLYDL